jgi:DNA sulfur modification protein DndD
VKLHELVLENFRQFAGVQRIAFATESQRNVTLVYGANGSGKTTLLNAFTWVLYEQLSPDFEQQGRLINDSIWAETPLGTEAGVKVTLHFEHNGEHYLLRRSARATRGTSDAQALGKTEVTLQVQNKAGASDQLEGANDRIDRILPRRLSSFFFFNGERMEHLVRREAYSEIEQAIKTLLGLEQVERAVKHLPQAQKKLEAELTKLGDPRIQELTEALNFERDKFKKADDDLKTAHDNLASAQDHKEAIDGNLRKLAATSELQRQRDDLEQRVRQSNERQNQAQQELRSILNDRGFLSFLTTLPHATLETAATLRAKGELPAPLKRQFVDDLLDHGQCICGTALVDGEEAHRHVSEWRRRAGLAEVEAMWGQVAAQAKGFLDDRATLATDLANLRGRVASEVATRKNLDDRLSAVSAQLSNLPLEDAQKLEARRNEWEQRIGQLQREIGRADLAKRDAEGQQQKLERELGREKLHDERAEVARRRVSVVRDVREALAKVLDIRTNTVRCELDERIRVAYKSITFKPYAPELNENFELELWQNVKGSRLTVPKSTGENQILSLSFVGALAGLARERAEGQHDGVANLPGSEGAIFPIVMDAAFGNLDDSYRRDIARSLPRLAPQVVVLVSKAQGEGPVAGEMASYCGREHVLTYFSTKEEDHDEQIELHGHLYPYVSTRTQSERAEILEVAQ